MNISENDTQPELNLANSLIYSVPVSIVIGIILYIFTLMTIVFNLGGALIFLMDKNLHTFSDCLIINLMLADGSIGLLVMPMKVILTLTSDVWVWSRGSCLAFITIEATTNLVSVINTFIVTLDHYWLVQRRQKYTAKQTHRLLLFMCIAPWISVFVFYGSPHFLTEFALTKSQDMLGVCAPPFRHDLGIFLILLVTPFVPIIAVPVYDTLIYFALRRQLFTKVKSLLDSESVDVADLAAIGINTEINSKSLLSFHHGSFQPHMQESMESTQSEGSLYLDESTSDVDPDDSRVDPETSVEINSTAELAAIKWVSHPNVRNSNYNADEPDARQKNASPAQEEEEEEAVEEAVEKEHEANVEVLEEFVSDVKEARLSLTLGTVLVITCTPFESLNFIVAICDIIQSCSFTFPPRLLQGCRWWVLLSSTINPVLIFTLDHRYKAGLFRFFRRLRGKSIAVESTDAKNPVSSL